MSAPRSIPTTWPDSWLVQLLLDRSVIRPDDLDTILSTDERSAWLACTRSGIAADDAILAVVSVRYAMPLVDPTHIDPGAGRFLEEGFARAHSVVPLRLDSRVLEVATSDPQSPTLQSDIAFACGRRTRLFLVSPAQLDDLLAQLYSERDNSESLASTLASATLFSADLETGTCARELPLLQLVDVIIERAVGHGASEILLDPEPLGLSVRFRAHDRIIEMQVVPAGLATPLVQRLKTLASLDAAERARPQEGRAEAWIDGRHIELHVATEPVRGRGENVVVTLLEPAAVAVA